MQEISSMIEESLGITAVEDNRALASNYFKWDTHCPQFILFHPSVRTKLAQSQLVKKFKVVVQVEQKRLTSTITSTFFKRCCPFSGQIFLLRTSHFWKNHYRPSADRKRYTNSREFSPHYGLPRRLAVS